MTRAYYRVILFVHSYNSLNLPTQMRLKYFSLINFLMFAKSTFTHSTLSFISMSFSIFLNLFLSISLLSIFLLYKSLSIYSKYPLASCRLSIRFNFSNLDAITEGDVCNFSPIALFFLGDLGDLKDFLM